MNVGNRGLTFGPMGDIVLLSILTTTKKVRSMLVYQESVILSQFSDK